MLLLVCVLPHCAIAQSQAAIDSLFQLLPMDALPTVEEMPQSQQDIDLLREVDRLSSEMRAKVATPATIDSLLVAAQRLTPATSLSSKIKLLQVVVKQSKLLEYPHGQQKGLSQLGIVYKFQGQYEKALHYYFKSLAIATQRQDTKAVANIHIDVGSIYFVRGSYEKAMSSYLEALKMARTTEDQRLFLGAFTGVGLVHYGLEDYPKASYFHSKALQLAIETDNIYYKAVAYANLGDVFLSTQNHRKALDYLFKSKRISESINDSIGISAIFNQMGKVYEQQGQNMAAFKAYKSAMELTAQNHLQAEFLMPLIDMGRVLIKQNHSKAAQPLLTRALKIARKKEMIKSAQAASLQLSLAEKELGNYQAAYAAQLIYKAMSDSLQHADLTKKITRLEAKYEFEHEKDSIQYINQVAQMRLKADLKRQEDTQMATYIGLGLISSLALVLLLFFRSKYRSNQLLRAQTEALQTANREIAVQKDAISQSNEELEAVNALKNRIFSIVAHDLRSPIQSLQGLLMLFSVDDAIPPSKMRQMMLDLTQKVQGISGLLNNLLYWSQTQMKGSLQLSPEAVNPRLMIEEAIELLSEAARIKNIDTSIVEENGSLKAQVDPEILRFLLRNLLSNAYKFSSPNGEVAVSVESTEGNQIKFSIADQGVGMDEPTRKALFKDFVKSKHGTQSETGTGLGLKLCKDFIVASHGNIGVESAPNTGSTFWFTTPSTL